MKIELDQELKKERQKTKEKQNQESIINDTQRLLEAGTDDEKKALRIAKLDHNVRVVEKGMGVEIEREKIESIGKLKEERDQSKVDSVLKRLEKDAAEGRNTMPGIIDACSAYATLGEISGVFRKCFGEYRGSQMF